MKAYLRILGNNKGTSYSTNFSWFSTLSVAIALGVLLTVLGYNASRNGQPGSDWFYWSGLVVQFAPVTVRLFDKRTSRQETISLLLVLGLGLYLSKLLYSPLEFRFVDELQQWRSIHDAIDSNHLFVPNPILPVSSYYPGLLNTVIAVVSLSGLSIFTSGVIVIGAVRVMLMLVLYLFFEQIGREPRVAGMATLLYTANPNFFGWSSYVVYQSLALPLAFLVLHATVKLGEVEHRSGWIITAILGIGAVIVTHHITSYALAFYLALFAAVPNIWLRLSASDRYRQVTDYVQRHLQRVYEKMMRLFQHFSFNASLGFEKQGVGWSALLTVVGIVLWTMYVAEVTIEYLGPQLTDIISEVVGLLTGTLTYDRVFVPPSRPPLELGLGLAAVGLITLGLPYGILTTLRKYKGDSLVLSMIVGSLGYFLSLFIRFISHRGGELFSRMWSFLFLLLGFMLANCVLELHDQWWPRLMRVIMPLMVVILFIGNIVNGWPPPYSRLPGPYLVGAYERSADIESRTATDWALEMLGPNNRMATDFMNHHLLGGYGLQRPVLGLTDIFISPRFEDYERNMLISYELEYLVVDLRMSESLPLSGFYFGGWEPSTHPHTEPISLGALTKFEVLPTVDRIYDSGSIVFYDVHEIR